MYVYLAGYWSSEDYVQAWHSIPADTLWPQHQLEPHLKLVLDIFIWLATSLLQLSTIVVQGFSSWCLGYRRLPRLAILRKPSCSTLTAAGCRLWALRLQAPPPLPPPPVTDPTPGPFTERKVRIGACKSYWIEPGNSDSITHQDCPSWLQHYFSPLSVWFLVVAKFWVFCYVFHISNWIYISLLKIVHHNSCIQISTAGSQIIFFVKFWLIHPVEWHYVSKVNASLHSCYWL